MRPAVLLILALFLLSLYGFDAHVFAAGGRGSRQEKNTGASASSSEEEVDYYAVLELTDRGPEVSLADIKQQYKKLSRKYHPDVNRDANTEEAKERYNRINRAYEVLSDKKKRKMYDMRGEEGLRLLQQAGQQPQRHAHPLAHLFDGGDNGVQGGSQELRVQVSLESIFTGATRDIEYQKQKVCPRCKGSGGERGAGEVRCPQCAGKGVQVQRVQFGMGMVQEIQQPCQRCHGQGRVFRVACPRCGGQKIGRGPAKLSLEVEQGIPEGHQVQFEMEADEVIDRLPGDLMVTIVSKPHPKFSRRENGIDLDTTLTVTMSEALLGFTHTITHLDGKEEVVVRGKGVTQFGSIIRVPKKGMPRHHTPSERGDLYVRVEFSLPRVLTANQRSALERAFAGRLGYSEDA